MINLPLIELGCAGEVQLSKPVENGEYDRWGINILVKFRDTEKLQVLTAQRQSGGVWCSGMMLYSFFPLTHAVLLFSITLGTVRIDNVVPNGPPRA
jgi:hypothetical protein